jgi:predicted RNase H-like nuclease (RuvC/YqgF family)
LYSDLLKSYLNKTKLENKVAKLEEHVKREKGTSKGWKLQVKKLENDLIAQGSKDKENINTKKLLDDKVKQIESLQKKLKMPVTDHPQTYEIMAY